eukprot:COSAG01_NODE_166_length_23296_cov_140.506014_10_plen_39_part_00
MAMLILQLISELGTTTTPVENSITPGSTTASYCAVLQS